MASRIGLTGARSNRFHNRSLCREFPRLELRVNQISVHGDLETPPGTRLQFERRDLRLVGRQQLLRQTDGFGFVVSRSAVAQVDFHPQVLLTAGRSRIVGRLLRSLLGLRSRLGRRPLLGDRWLALRPRFAAESGLPSLGVLLVSADSYNRHGGYSPTSGKRQTVTAHANTREPIWQRNGPVHREAANGPLGRYAIMGPDVNHRPTFDPAEATFSCRGRPAASR